MAPKQDQERQRKSWFGRLRGHAPAAATVGHDVTQNATPGVLSSEDFARATTLWRARVRRPWRTGIGAPTEETEETEETMARRTDPYQDKYPTKAGWAVSGEPRWIVTHFHCCGIKELHGVQNAWSFYNKKSDLSASVQPEPNVQMKAIKSAIDRYYPPRAIWIFSDNDKRSALGEKLAQYIEEHKLGTVVRSGYHYNPNSGNDIQMYTWIIDNEAFREHKPVV